VQALEVDRLPEREASRAINQPPSNLSARLILTSAAR
jgi:hypothetical protein